MTNHMLERQINLVINLLESLPKRMCDEIEKRDNFKKFAHLEQLKSNMDFYKKNNEEINKFISGFTEGPIRSEKWTINPMEIGNEKNPK